MDTYLSLLGFIAVMVGTPGPANLLLTIGGVQFWAQSLSTFHFGLNYQETSTKYSYWIRSRCFCH